MNKVKSSTYKKEQLEKLKIQLAEEVLHLVNGHSINPIWTSATIIHIIDNIKYIQNPEGVFENSIRSIRKIIDEGRLKELNVTGGI